MTTPVATIWAALIGAAVATGGLLLTWFISRRQRIADFRMAALDKRLEAHQAAYRLWHELVWALDDPDKGPETVARCEQWWIDHCLYMDATSRKEFLQCAHEAGLHRVLKDAENPGERKARFKRILKVFNLLEKGVHLPSIGGLEKRP
jgi:hypothetical protein